jgi:hypothetical protein
MIERPTNVYDVMSKTVEAEYDQKQLTLLLDEPLVGLRDHERVQVTVTSKADSPALAWREIHEAFAGKAGEEFARAIEDAFPIEK